jgi:hypothetical protein
MLRARNFKLGIMIDHDQQMNPFDFGVKRSKVKVIFSEVKNDFHSIPKGRLGLGTLNLV